MFLWLSILLLESVWVGRIQWPGDMQRIHGRSMFGTISHIGEDLLHETSFLSTGCRFGVGDEMSLNSYFDGYNSQTNVCP